MRKYYMGHLFMMIVIGAYTFYRIQNAPKEISVPELIATIKKGNVVEISLSTYITGQFKNPEISFRTDYPKTDELNRKLAQTIRKYNIPRIEGPDWAF